MHLFIVTKKKTRRIGFDSFYSWLPDRAFNWVRWKIHKDDRLPKKRKPGKSEEICFLITQEETDAIYMAMHMARSYALCVAYCGSNIGAAEYWRNKWLEATMVEENLLDGAFRKYAGDFFGKNTQRRIESNRVIHLTNQLVIRYW